MIRLVDLHKVYGKPGTNVEVHALRGVSMEIRRGDYLAIIGSSGSGKSTLMNILGCLDRPTRGRYELYGDDVTYLDDDQLSDVRGRRIGFVFQSFNLIPALTVLENLETPLFYQSVPARARMAKARELLERVGLADRAEHRPVELSGGQQQRVAIARALMTDPVMLLADEPTGNLDSRTGQMILALLEQLNAGGTTVVLVTHDPNIARRVKRCVELSDGLIVQDRVNSDQVRREAVQAHALAASAAH
ncbi:MAG: ABC transporter ATP-binding protein [Planctomycetia bacterium]|nr:MAG: ABC transporter ATP-binding protein [Planctomycetia bacterium]